MLSEWFRSPECQAIPDEFYHSSNFWKQRHNENGRSPFQNDGNHTTIPETHLSCFTTPIRNAITLQELTPVEDSEYFGFPVNNIESQPGSSVHQSDDMEFDYYDD